VAQGLDDFHFSLPYEKIDLALWAHNNGVAHAEFGPHVSLTEEQAQAVYADIEARRGTTAYLHARPMLFQEAFPK
jgi:NAD+ synthase